MCAIALLFFCLGCCLGISLAAVVLSRQVRQFASWVLIASAHALAGRVVVADTPAARRRRLGEYLE